MQDLKKKVYTEPSIPHISYLLQESQEKFEEAVDLIEEMSKPKPPIEPGSVPPKPKQIKTVKPADLAFKPYLETEKDVEDYVQKLLDTLIAVIKKRYAGKI